MGKKMPSLFFGHGNPMNVLRTNTFTESWRRLGVSIPRPKAILAVSAHWYIADTAVTTGRAPETIHDFYGFPKDLFEVTYPAPGSPEVAERVCRLLLPLHVRSDDRRGLDHGVWSVLCHMYPYADIPVVQLSIASTREPEFHFETGQRLEALRDEGVLVIGSGNIIHNLHAYRWDDQSVPAFDWALRFERETKRLMDAGNGHQLVDFMGMGDDARLASPTPEHFLPLLYILGLRKENEQLSYPVEGIEGGALSMLSVRVG